MIPPIHLLPFWHQVAILAVVGAAAVSPIWLPWLF